MHPGMRPGMHAVRYLAFAGAAAEANTGNVPAVAGRLGNILQNMHRLYIIKPQAPGSVLRVLILAKRGLR
jgi:hypothetical protein